MPRPRSPAVAAVKAKLIARLSDGLHRPGQRFFSNRALVRLFGVSYQTAHRLVAELEAEGWLRRKAASGTYVAGASARLAGVELWFHPRARRAGSFGARLLAMLQEALTRADVPARTRFADEPPQPEPRRYPVVWECPELAAVLARERRNVLLLNERPTPGLTASFVDSVSTDDFSGGVAAAEIMMIPGKKVRCAVLAGPADDERSRQRVAGFRSLLPGACIVSAGGWYFENAIAVAPKVLGYDGVFCCNDRLAEAVLAAAGRRPAPRVVGFDDAPVSERLNFTTIAIPWAEIVAAAVRTIKGRLGGDHSPAAQLIFAPRPIMRGMDVLNASSD